MGVARKNDGVVSVSVPGRSQPMNGRDNGWQCDHSGQAPLAVILSPSEKADIA